MNYGTLPTRKKSRRKLEHKSRDTSDVAPRDALLSQICGGARLKPSKHLMNDRSRPILGSSNGIKDLKRTDVKIVKRREPDFSAKPALPVKPTSNKIKYPPLPPKPRKTSEDLGKEEVYKKISEKGKGSFPNDQKAFSKSCIAEKLNEFAENRGKILSWFEGGPKLEKRNSISLSRTVSENLYDDKEPKIEEEKEDMKSETKINIYRERKNSLIRKKVNDKRNPCKETHPLIRKSISSIEVNSNTLRQNTSPKTFGKGGIKPPPFPPPPPPLRQPQLTPKPHRTSNRSNFRIEHYSLEFECRFNFRTLDQLPKPPCFVAFKKTYPSKQKITTDHFKLKMKEGKKMVTTV